MKFLLAALISTLAWSSAANAGQKIEFTVEAGVIIDGFNRLGVHEQTVRGELEFAKIDDTEYLATYHFNAELPLKRPDTDELVPMPFHFSVVHMLVDDKKRDTFVDSYLINTQYGPRHAGVSVKLLESFEILYVEGVSEQVKGRDGKPVRMSRTLKITNFRVLSN